MTATPDITIIGGGVIGMLTAREFNNAGAKVRIVDKCQLGQESSWAGGGILLPLYPWRQAKAISELTLHSLKLYPSLAEQLLADTGLDPEWTQCGLLITKNPDIQTATRWCEHNDIFYLPPPAHLLEPLNTKTCDPLWLPGIAQIRNPRLVKALKQDLTNRKIIIDECAEVTDINQTNGRVTTITTPKGTESVNELIIAGGAWSGRLFAKLFSGVMLTPIEISPIRGQMLVFDAAPGSLNHIVLAENHYLIPRRDGKILAGSTVEQVDFDKTTTETAKNQLSRFAIELLPELKKFPISHHWAGLRPGTHLGVPYIARHPELANVSINAGHFRNGLVLGPASAQLLADVILKRKSSVAPEPYQFSSPH